MEEFTDSTKIWKCKYCGEEKCEECGNEVVCETCVTNNMKPIRDGIITSFSLVMITKYPLVDGVRVIDAVKVFVNGLDLEGDVGECYRKLNRLQADAVKTEKKRGCPPPPLKGLKVTKK